jgi:MurNAc alpha-1-phosphate uridylyltransferase
MTHALKTAMIFAAGRGERMRPLTDTCPKPLLEVAGKPLIVWQIERLAAAGVETIVINHAWLGEQIEAALGRGSRWGLELRYSPETEALETAGGIAQARHLLGEEPFLAISGDIYCPYFDFEQVKDVLHDKDMWGNPYPPDKRDAAWIWLAKNPWHNPKGDFALKLYSVANEGDTMWNFGGIGVYRMEMFDGIAPGQAAGLGKLLRQYADLGRVGGELYEGEWVNVGTVEQLDELNGVAPGAVRP